MFFDGHLQVRGLCGGIPETLEGQEVVFKMRSEQDFQLLDKTLYCIQAGHFLHLALHLPNEFGTALEREGLLLPRFLSANSEETVFERAGRVLKAVLEGLGMAMFGVEALLPALAFRFYNINKIEAVFAEDIFPLH